MAISFFVNWPLSWSSTSIAASTITNTSSATTAAISNDSKYATEVAVTVAYGGTASEGIKWYILRDSDAGYEAAVDNGWAGQLAATVSTTHRRTITVPASSISRFKVHLINNSGASVTATVTYQQAVFEQG